MGNAVLSMKRKKAVMVIKLDGSTLRLKPPVTAGDVISDHPGHSLLDSEEVKRRRADAQALQRTHALEAGKHYFLVALPKVSSSADRRSPRRSWSTVMHVSAVNRLEGLKLSRRSTSDLSHAKHFFAEEVSDEGTLRVRIRLSKAQVTELIGEGGDRPDVAENIIMALLAKKMDQQASTTSTSQKPKTRRTRFAPVADEN